MTTNWDLSFIYKGFDDTKIDEDLQSTDLLAEGFVKYRIIITPTFMSILESGGSQFPVDLSALVDLDIRKEDF